MIENNSGPTITDTFVENLEKDKRKAVKRLASAIKADSNGKIPKGDFILEEYGDEIDEVNDIEMILAMIEADRKESKKEMEEKQRRKYESIGSGEDAAKALFTAAFGEDYFDEYDE